MKLAFVFPGQGSQALGMMNGFAAHPVVHRADARDRLGGIIDTAERGYRDEVAGALQPTPRIAAVAGVSGDPGHGERMERLQQQRAQTAHVHRRVRVHGADRPVGSEPALARRVVDPLAVQRAVLARNAIHDEPAEPTAKINDHPVIFSMS